MNTAEQKVKYALDTFSKLQENFQGLISNPEHKLNLIRGVDVAPSDQDNLRLEVLGKEIEIRFKIVFLEEFVALGQISSFLINNSSEEENSETSLLSIWFDHLGNIKSPEPTSSGFSHVNDESALSKFVVDTIEQLINSSECKPAVNG